MKRRRRYLADGPARRTSRCTAGAGTRSARSRTMHSPAAAATLQTNPRDALVVPLLTQMHAEREVLQCTAPPPPPPPPLPCRRTRDATSCRETVRRHVVQRPRVTRSCRKSARRDVLQRDRVVHYILIQSTEWPQNRKTWNT